MHVIGTAGHVDHGKSALVRALTGIDPDRLAEERERGLTIDLGFAWLTLPSGEEVSIVDVPGHERFIKNMLAGAGGIELALLVVAADEGPMPQTREHLAILDRLEVPSGIVVVTKTDLVDPEYLELVQMETRDALAGSRLAEAPMLAVSALTGDGLPGLLAAIDDSVRAAAPHRDLRRPRLPIDRVFTVQGFGTVVTGTLIDGALEVGQEVEVQPGGIRARVRGLQRHKTRVPRLEPGTRAAVNLSGVDAGEVLRGMVVTLPSTVAPARVLDVLLTATPVMRHPVPHDAVVTVLAATAETQARVRLLDGATLEQGESRWAQLVLESDLAVVPGDHCILRTPNDTVAGGVVAAVNPRRHRRNHQPTLQALLRALEGSHQDRILDRLAQGPASLAELGQLSGAEPGEVRDTVESLRKGRLALLDGATMYGRDWLDSAQQRVCAIAAEYLAAHPLRRAAPREHVRSQAGWSASVFDRVARDALARGLVRGDVAGSLAPAGHTVVLSPAQQAEADRFLDSLRSSPYSPPTDWAPADELAVYLEEAGVVVRTRGGVVYAREAFDEMRERTLAWCREHGQVSLAEVRDLFGTSRKYAQAFLEHLDDLRITRRAGDVRVLRAEFQATPD